jgi:MFS family permease
MIDDVTVAGSVTTRVGWSGLLEAVRIPAFRRLWLVLGLSSLGDWLGLLATAAFASAQVSTSAAKGLAFGSVIAVQLLPALVLGPLAGILADRFDRRRTMVTLDLTRFALFASIPLAGLITHRPLWVVGWAVTAMFAVQAAAMLWVPAKEAAVPNLLPRGLLEMANRLTLATTYGVTPVVAAVLFAGMARLPQLGPLHPTDIALLFNALTFLASAAVVYFGIREISGRRGESPPSTPGVWAQIVFAWRYIASSRLVRGLVTGVLGAFAGAGVVVGTARFYASSLGGGDATFGILFGALFAGFGLGVVVGPNIVGDLSRRRWFALSIVLAGGAVMILALAPQPIMATIASSAVGCGAGMAFLSGTTLLGGEVDDAVRGRVFAFVQTAVRITLMLSIALSGFLVGVGASRRIELGTLWVDVSATRVLLLLAGACGVLVGLVTLRQIDDRQGVPILRDLFVSLLHRRTS